MKKLLLTIIMITIMWCGGSIVNATSLDLTVTCKDTTLNKNTQCVLTGRVTNPTPNPDGGATGIAGFEAKYSINSNNGNASFVNFTPGNGFYGEGSDGYITVFGDTHTSTFTIGTLTLKGTKVGKVNLVLSDIIAFDNVTFDDINLPSKTVSFQVK